jgi:hypothetical protein
VDRAVAWSLVDEPGLEVAFVRTSASRLAARGAAVRSVPEPYELRYSLRTADRFITRRLRVRARGAGWRRALDLRRGADGTWECAGRVSGRLDAPAPGCDPVALAGALDCDLGLSPLTNSMPVLRHSLLDGGAPVDLLMAWVSVPDLQVHASEQHYEFVARDGERSIVRYRGPKPTATYDIVFDPDGLVVDYPSLARRVSG